jgi:hypothetical protein
LSFTGQSATQKVAIFFTHGVGTHARNRRIEGFAERLRRALQAYSEHGHGGQWKRVANRVDTAQGVVHCEQLECQLPNGQLVSARPIIHVFDAGWSGGARSRGFRWSAIPWLYRKLPFVWAVVAKEPAKKKFYDVLSVLAAIALAIFLAVVALFVIPFLCVKDLIWFLGLNAPARIESGRFLSLARSA